MLKRKMADMLLSVNGKKCKMKGREKCIVVTAENK